MERDEIFHALRTELAAVLDADPDTIVLDARLAETLGADSVDLIEAAGVFEARWDIHIDDRDLHDLVTVDDFVGLLHAKTTR